MTDPRADESDARQDRSDQRADESDLRAQEAEAHVDRTDVRAIHRAAVVDGLFDEAGARTAELEARTLGVYERLDDLIGLMSDGLKSLADKIDEDIASERHDRKRSNLHRTLAGVAAVVVVLILGSGVTVGFHRGIVRNCQAGNAKSALIYSLIHAPVNTAPPGATPEQVQQYHDQAARYFAFADPLLLPVDCTHVGWLP